MDKFERSEYEAEQAALARHNVMDEDGFTLVTSAKGTKGANSDGVISIKAVKAEDVKHIKPKKKELQDFYRFQMREAKRDSTYSGIRFVNNGRDGFFGHMCVVRFVSLTDFLSFWCSFS